MNRRSFLKSLLAGAASLVAIPVINSAPPKKTFQLIIPESRTNAFGGLKGKYIDINPNGTVYFNGQFTCDNLPPYYGVDFNKIDCPFTLSNGGQH